ncbi:MAG TPA: ribosome biogenesis GTPase YlqF [Negativicutes bacterium]
MHINWFPGHMAKAHRMIRDQLKLVDVVIELLDARIPISSANPLIQDVVENKPRIVALNKADMAEPEWTERWVAAFSNQGLPVIALDSIGGKGMKSLISQVERVSSDKIAKMVAKGIKPRAVRAMILGIPNVGKSSLINKLLGAATVRTADKPGVTRGKQWIKIGKNLDLLDTPGVLWPKFQDPNVAFKLAVTGAINDDVYDMEQLIDRFLNVLRENYSHRLAGRYNLTLPLPDDNLELLGLIGTRRGCLRSGGLIDYEKARRILLTEFRTGKLGAFTLDRPEPLEV